MTCFLEVRGEHLDLRVFSRSFLYIRFIEGPKDVCFFISSNKIKVKMLAVLKVGTKRLKTKQKERFQ